MSTAYVVLARKWRPAQFSDIVGQTHIVRTLMNTIQSNRLHQAYLFTGSRGIGKTSIARIFGKLVRCQENKKKDDWFHSCDACSNCKEITAGTSVDVMEIDGASNNGVDAVREIRENAKYLPSSGSKKIYIIDEVHMLTTAAFNALLKTLEEPPEHVIFIFATTEPHKIPATILSRCQRFDFRRVTPKQIQTRLKEVVDAEKIETEEGALPIVARAAEGSMRDALSLLDQIIAYSGNKITAQSVRESIGLIESQTLLSILRGVFERKPLDALSLVQKAYQQGHDLRILTQSLIELIHGSILAKVGSTLEDGGLEFSEEEWKEIQEISKLREIEEMELIFQVLHHGLDGIARSSQPKTLLDIILVKCATAEALISLDEVSHATEKSKAQAPEKPARPHALAPTPRPQPQLKAEPKPEPLFDRKMFERKETPVRKKAPVSTPAKKPAIPGGPKNWENFTRFVTGARPILGSILEHALNAEIPENGKQVLVIFYSSQQDSYKHSLESRNYRNQLLDLVTQYFGEGTDVEIQLRDGVGESLAGKRQREQKEKIEAAEKAVQEHPIIQEAQSLFGGKLGPIELTQQKQGESRATQ